MLDEATYKRITNLKAMAQMVVQEADELLRLKQPASSLEGCKKNKGLTDEQRAHMIAKRRKSVARSYKK